MADTTVVWFRRDLRVHDHEPLTSADGPVIGVYAFDPRLYDRREFGGHDSFRYQKTGSHRTQFRREAVADLRQRLRELGSELLVRHDRPERAVPAVATALDADRVAFHSRPTPEERTVESRVETRLREEGIDPRRSWGHTLYHPADLGEPYTEIPDTYTPFRQAVEEAAEVRSPLGAPSSLTPPAEADSVEAGSVPDRETLGVPTPPTDERRVCAFDGGETAAKRRLEAYMWDGDNLREYKQTRNGLLGADYSSKFSPWLNEGCLSPRFVNSEVERYERERVANDDTYWLVFELLWRDFFQFQFAKHGATHFSREGIRRRTDIDWRDDDSQFERWAAGETGIPFVDANMRELNRTGYMSNRGRQNVASFLANDLRLDWRRGAAYFETQLVDYDPCSNYGNWAYIAGVGNDSRNRSFDVLNQAERYDPNGEYVRHWLPALADAPTDAIHRPWTLSPGEQAANDLHLGVDYPQPMIDPDDPPGLSS